MKRKIKDKKLLWLIKIILSNHKTKEKNRGMPLGNLTSQFFANVYLNELDQFVKHKLREKYYIRYVDDFVILHKSKEVLDEYKHQINNFLQEKLKLELHPDKSKIFKLNKGIGFLGFRIFYYHRLVRKKNLRKFDKKFNKFKILYTKDEISREKIVDSFEGWLAYISHAHTYKYRRNLTKIFNCYFPLKDDFQILNIRKNQNFIKKIEESNLPFSSQKTLLLFRRGLTVKEISQIRNIMESTVWEHLAKLIEHNHLSIWQILPKKKISGILLRINDKNDKLKDIKNQLDDNSITFNEINCVLASLKCGLQNIKI